MTHRGEPVDPKAIRNVALLTVEGENDDISGVGQTEAAHELCINIPAEMRAHYMQPAVGHYGVFNGSRFRSEIVPRIVDFIASYGRSRRSRRASRGWWRGQGLSRHRQRRSPTCCIIVAVAWPVTITAIIAPALIDIAAHRP